MTYVTGPRNISRTLRRLAPAAAVLWVMGLSLAGASAQTVEPPAANGGDWSAGVHVKKTAPATATPATRPNTTVIERSGDKAAVVGPSLKLVALLTENGQEIDQGLVWRIFQHSADPASKSKLIAENREASPELKLPPGDYTVNAAFGRANLTRKVTVKAGAANTEKFVLNAGGLRVSALVGGQPAPSGMISYAVYSDDHDQYDGRSALMSGAKPGLIVRLNAGIYRVVSTYGDANAKVETDITVEAGKLTEATLVHAAGKVSFKLVTREGGEALPDTHWLIQTPGGDTVKESVGALPTHVLAPGSYTIAAKSAGHMFTRSFSVKDGETQSLEVLMDKDAAAGGREPAPTLSGSSDVEPNAAGISPNMEIKIP